MKTSICLIFFLFSINSNSQHGKEIPKALIHNYKIRPGDQANLNIKHWILNVPDDKNFGGKFLIVTYWGGTKVCQNALQELEEIYSSFQHKHKDKLLLITYANKDSITVAKQFKELNIETKSIVVSNINKIDKLWSTGLDSIMSPITLLIDDRGQIIYSVTPNSINNSVLERFLDKKLEKGCSWRL